jgi:hypothetical protein
MAERQARFVRIARAAHECARRDLGPQQLKPRDWEEQPASDRVQRHTKTPGSWRA